MSSSNQAPPKKSKGRQKVNMVKMENESNLQVTFSKRRAGLFKKASELCTLCGAQAAIVVFSPADKVYCFGHPNVKTVLDRFAAGVAPPPSNTTTNQLIFEAHRNSTIRELNLELTQVESMLRVERMRGEQIDLIRKAGLMQQWIPDSFDEFNFAQLCALKESITGFKTNFDVKMQKDMRRLANQLPSYNYPPPEKMENPRGFPLGVDVDVDVGHFTTFNTQLSLGTNDLSPYAHGGIEFSDRGLFAHGETHSSSLPMTTSSTTGLFSYDYLRPGTSLNANVFFADGRSSSSNLPIDPTTIGNRDVNGPSRFNI
ncbi:Agamous-like MADS-box protein [Sesamum alatum]|uniref:Agamous-like MADS-box protein n=1 Tax=Sesamum alatum TaxID=300844 RepID=A0AAE1YXD7_9LAMI|nr:Agamous-like MADS-box protein [Sesamum alatum]